MSMIDIYIIVIFYVFNKSFDLFMKLWNYEIVLCFFRKYIWLISVLNKWEFLVLFYGCMRIGEEFEEGMINNVYYYRVK